MKISFVKFLSFFLNFIKMDVQYEKIEEKKNFYIPQRYFVSIMCTIGLTIV